MSENSTRGILLVLVVGLAMVGFGGYMWLEQGERIRDYESTEATVLSSSVGSGSDVGDDYIDVTYEYTVDGQTYRSSNVEPGAGRGSMSRTRVEEFVENHPEGSTLTIYYDPEDPSNAYVLQERNLAFPGMAAFGALFTLVALVSLVRLLTGGST